MAREKCYKEYCWDYDELIRYEPLDDKKLLAWLPASCYEGSDYPCSDERKNKIMVERLKKLREYYGFSLLLLWPDYCANYWAHLAGWKKDQIVLNISTDGHGLDTLAAISDQWRNYGDNANRIFHSIFLDEPHDTSKYVNQPIITWDYVEFFPTGWNTLPLGLDIFLPRVIKRSELVDLCNGPDFSKYLDFFKASHRERFYLLSLYIHECMKSKLVVGEYNTIINNWWRDIHSLNDSSYTIEGDSTHNNWVDSIIYVGYDADQFDEWRDIRNAGISGGMTVINSRQNLYEPGRHNQRPYDVALHEAMLGGYNEVWFFPSPKEHNCDEFERKMKLFCDAAATKGFLKPIYERKRKCELYEIPGCKEGIFYPFEINTPFMIS